MAEITVFLAIQKIGLAVTAEAQQLISSKLPGEVELITQVPSSIKRIRREFVVMQAFLSNTDSYKKSAALEAWLQELRKIANEVEDVVDKFVYLLGGDRLNGVSGLFKKIIGRPQNHRDWRDIALKLKELESDLQHITQIKDRWIKMETITDSLANATEMQLAQLLDRVNDGETAVGIDENMKKLEKMLLTPENSSSNRDSSFSSFASNNHSRHWPDPRPIRQQQHGGFLGINMQQPWGAKNQSEIKAVQPAQTIAVFGQTGVGKSFLVSQFYDSVKAKFDLHALVHAPLDDNLENLLKLLVKKLEGKDVSQRATDNTPRLEVLKQILAKKKYLIILDDVRETLYDKIKHVLVSEVSGCRVIITTDSNDVARLVDKQFQLEVKPLNAKQAMSLLLKKAFPKENFTQCPKELETSADKIIEHCGGLPTVLVSVAVFLSQKERVKSEWNNVSQQFEWLVENSQKLSRPKIAFELGLKGLPNSLKNCYLFCSMFPKDFSFKRKRLIRILVAEGFVEQRGNSSMEKAAEEDLNELVNRFMFQVVAKNIHGRLRRFKLQAFKHEILMSISKREQFCMLWTDQEKVYRSNEVRHLCLHKYSINSGSNIDMPQLRSLLIREGDISYQLLSSMLSNSRYLMVLDLQKTGISKIPESIGELFNLQYLNLRQTKIKKLPKTVGRLTKLQTLDAICTEITELPREITKLKKLRHLFVGRQLDHFVAAFDSIRGVEAPGRFRDLKYLQTLKGINASKEFVEDLEELTCLRSLTISKVKESQSNHLFSSLERLTMLLKLDISALNDKEQLILSGLDAVMSVQKLKLQGRLVDAAPIRSVKNLTSLHLRWTGMSYDKFALLGDINTLESLKVSNALPNCETMSFIKGAFTNLKRLCLRNLETLKIVTFEKGAMENLEVLELYNLPNVKKVPNGLESLEKLKKLHLKHLHHEFSGEEARSKTTHGATVDIVQEPLNLPRVAVRKKVTQEYDWFTKFFLQCFLCS